jgi:hypothetical protein
MTRERRDHITALIFGEFAARTARYNGNAKNHPVPYASMVLSLLHGTDLTREEIDHVLVALCSRLCVNLIAGEIFFTAAIRPDSQLDSDSIDWLYGSGRYAQ